MKRRAKLDRAELAFNRAVVMASYDYYMNLEPNCHSCEEFGGVCKKYGEVPPDFMLKGCDEWHTENRE